MRTKNSVILCVFSVKLCVTKNYYTEEKEDTQRTTEKNVLETESLAINCIAVAVYPIMNNKKRQDLFIWSRLS